MDADDVVTALDWAGAPRAAEAAKLALGAKRLADAYALLRALRALPTEQAALVLCGLPPEDAETLSRMVRGQPKEK